MPDLHLFQVSCTPACQRLSSTPAPLTFTGPTCTAAARVGLAVAGSAR